MFYLIIFTVYLIAIIYFMHFLLEQVIGEGAFGKVIRAELDLSLAPIGDRNTGTMDVAVKVLKGQ